MTKRKGTTSDISTHRLSDIVRVFREVMRTAPLMTAEDFFATIAKSPTKRFWVSAERATDVVLAMQKGDTLRGMRTEKQKMYNEIYKRVSEMCRCNPGMSIEDAVAEVVEQPAPEFYLHPTAIRQYIYRYQRGVRKHGNKQ